MSDAKTRSSECSYLLNHCVFRHRDVLQWRFLCNLIQCQYPSAYLYWAGCLKQIWKHPTSIYEKFRHRSLCSSYVEGINLPCCLWCWLSCCHGRFIARPFLATIWVRLISAGLILFYANNLLQLLVNCFEHLLPWYKQTSGNMVFSLEPVHAGLSQSALVWALTLWQMQPTSTNSTGVLPQ